MNQNAAPAGTVRQAGSYPESRFVRLRLPADAVSAHHLTLAAAAPGAAPPAPETNGALARLAQADPARAQRVAQAVARLIEREAEVLTWLEADPAHTSRFMDDPEAALREALPDLDPAFFEDWKG
ncbi:MAG TPA: hypothetical protein VFJ82_15375 [Longimicrobium sp.]|nr:hypothetical protein [Longimicrobium sp.]